MTDVVKLNVGGTIFETSKSTLTKFDGYFKSMLENWVPKTKDDSDAIFVDRDPTHFRLILNFMRDGHVDLQKYSEDVKEIQKEAEYYLLDGLKELCAQKSSESQRMPLIVESDNDVFKAVAESTKDAVLVFFYDKDPAHFSFGIELFIKHKAHIDFCFNKFTGDRGTMPYFLFHDKIKNKIDRGTLFNPDELDNIIRMFFEHADEYEDEDY
ncbi:hypothetical protein B9Z55_007881 [Caenorhabditis nigoni]|uniref:BTB domain-containing protein n=1 Tax=Caenorhabditis nigoni TaxID=1611254 RepID=A0A2G5VBM6_9PELO|nr:hypothetical protein B9Z55_007881 [Caenorhabditis nigoni]